MRLRSCCFALGIVFAASVAAAQSTTADGVHAILNGDYSTAARILKPLAENASNPDPIAQFFLAALYNSGQGVPYSMLHACSLYLGAATGAHPLTALARDIAAVIEEPYPGAHGGIQMCFSPATHPWGEAPPATFTIAPGYSVRMDPNSTTVTLDGVEDRTASSRFGPGIVWLPIEYTPLDVVLPSQGRRHFIQEFIWHHDGPSDLTTWSLGWVLDEVVGKEVRMVTGDPRLVTVVAPRPPAVDTSKVVELRVNAGGEAEWLIPDPSRPRGGIIR